MTRRLHHIALGTAHVEELSVFYRDVLGLAEVRRNCTEQGTLRSVWLDLGGALLMIERTLQAPRRVEGIGAGPFLLAFTTTSTERALVEQRLEAAGAAIESRTEYTSYARDPDGNRIAVSCYTQAPSA